jgi:phenylalanyl-tRNA synthetase beta subunit
MENRELTEEELKLILNKFGCNIRVKNDVIDSGHHTYKRKSKYHEESIIDDPELNAAFEQFNKDIIDEE